MLIDKDRRSLSKRIKNLKSLVSMKFMRKKILVIIFLVIFLCLGFLGVSMILLSGPFYKKIGATVRGIRNIPAYIAYLPTQYYRRITTRPERLFIEVSPRDYQRLMYWRVQALKKGFVAEECKKYINAIVRWNNKPPVNARLRLKGEVACFHMPEPKWSMRIVLDGENTIMGMNRFSLQHPQRRSYLRSYIFHKLLSLEGVMSINFDLVHATINGVDKGIYNLEEVVGPAMIKRSNQKEGVFVRFDEVPHMTERIEFPQGSANAYFGAAIRSYGMRYILGNLNLKKQYTRAVNLLNGFRQGDLKTHEVFDVKIMARWLAIGDVLGCWHGFSWGNLRFYYNPVLDRLQPIGWDGINENFYATPHNPVGITRIFRLDDEYMDPESVFWKELFSDMELLDEYIKAIDRVTEPSYLDQQLHKITNELKQYISVLQCDYPQFTLEEDIKDIKANQGYIRRVYLYPYKTFHTYFESYKDRVLTLGFANRKPIPVKILGVYYQGENIEFLPIGKSPLLVGKPPSKPSVYQKFQFLVPDFVQWNHDRIGELRVRYKTVGLSNVRNEAVFPWKRYSSINVYDECASLQEQFDTFPFLTVDEVTKEIRFKVGNWELKRTLKIPAGYTVYCGPGTRIVLNNASLISFSPLLFRGNAENPIIVSSRQKDNGGILIAKTSLASSFEYVRFRNLARPKAGDWEGRSSLTFYETPIIIANCLFERNYAENHVGITNSDVTISRSVFKESFLTALSINFSRCSLANIACIKSGGSALEFSDAHVSVDGMVIDTASADGIKADENSKVQISHCVISGCATGITCRNYAEITVDDILLKQCEVGFIIGQKNAYEGLSKIIVTDGKTKNVRELHRLAEGAEMIYNGVKIPGIIQRQHLLRKNNK